MKKKYLVEVELRVSRIVQVEVEAASEEEAEDYAVFRAEMDNTDTTWDEVSAWNVTEVKP